MTTQRRSNKQLKYAFGVVMRDLMAYAAEHYEPIDKETCKRHAYVAVGHYEYKTVFGRKVVVPKPTPKTTEGMEDLLEKIRAWGAGLEPPCAIMLPGETISYPKWP